MLLDGKENAISVLLFPFQNETVPDKIGGGGDTCCCSPRDAPFLNIHELAIWNSGCFCGDDLDSREEERVNDHVVLQRPLMGAAYAYFKSLNQLELCCDSCCIDL